MPEPTEPSIAARLLSTDPPDSWRGDEEDPPTNPEPWLGISGGHLYIHDRPARYGSIGRSVNDQKPFGDFAPGRYAWLLDNVRPIGPVPARGRQGLWERDGNNAAARR